jgi:hypothetical protein
LRIWANYSKLKPINYTIINKFIPNYWDVFNFQ